MTIKNKECNPKLYRADKICNPKTGRWVLKSSKVGIELMAKSVKKKMSVPVKKECNPKLYRADKICNPKTGRWVLKSSKAGLELMTKRRSLKQKQSIKDQSLRSLFGNLNLTNEMQNKKNIFLSTFTKIQKPKIDIYSMKHIGVSSSRTKASMYRVSLKHSNPDSIIKKYGNSETHQMHAFVKIVEVDRSMDPRMRLKSIREEPTVKEVELFRVTNMLQDDRVLDTVAYCLNDKLLQSDWGTFDSKNYSFLTTEDLVGYTTFFDQTFKTTPFDIILQLMYTLSCFQHIGLKHMDMHMWNFYVKKRPKPVNLRFEMKVSGRYENFYIRSEYMIKIIDFDGGSKVKVPGVKDKYSQTISNPKVFSGVTKGKYAPTSKVNFLKLIHSLVRYDESKMKTLDDYHNTMYKYRAIKMTSKDNNVPFLSRERVPRVLPPAHKNKVVKALGREKLFWEAHVDSQGAYNRLLLKTYGFYGKYGNNGPKFLDIPDSLVRSLDAVLMDMKRSGVFQNVLPSAMLFSQKPLFKQRR